MGAFKDTSIKHKLMRISLLTAGSALLLSALSLTVNELIVFKKSLLNELTTQTQIIGSNCTAALTFNDAKTAREILSALKANGNINLAAVYAKDGTLFADYSSDGKKLDLPHRLQKEGYRFGLNYVDVYRDIVLDNEVIGSIYIHSTLNALYDKFFRYAAVFLAAILLSLCAVYVMSNRLQKTMIGLISDLVRTMNTVSEGKDYSVRAAVRSRDELGALAEGFNDMLIQIQTRDSELEVYRRNLEELVNKRTAQLKITNVKLQRELAEHKKAEEAVKESEERYRQLVELSPDAIYIQIEGKIAFINAAGVRLFGAENNQEKLIGRPVIDLIHPDHRELVAARIRQLKEEKVEVPSIEEKYLRLDGTPVDVEVAATPFIFRGEPAAQVIAHDITARKHADEALREEKTFTENALNTIRDTFFVFDLQGRFLRWNKSLREVTGYSDEEITLMKPADFFPGEEVPKVLTAIEQVVRNGNSTLETTISTKDGRRFPYELRGAILRDHEGREIGICGTGRDITERKRAEEALRKSEEFIKNILETVDEGFIVIDPEYKIISANKAYLNMFNKSQENVIGEYCYKLIHGLCKPCSEIGDDCAVSRTLKTGMPQTSAHTHHDETGRQIFVEIKSFPVRNVTGKVVAAIEVINNITEKKKLEDQLRHSQKMEAIGTLAGGVAHDFNNILNVIIGYGTMVMDRLGEDRLSREQMKEVLAAADRAANLTKRLLTFSRKQIVDMKPVNVNEIILGMEKMLSRIIGEDIVFATELAAKKMFVMADCGQIEQVLMNLISNAHDAMPKGGRLTISTGIKEVDDAYITAYGYGKTGTYALICVTDTGSGMDAETQKKVFEPFFTTKGIGLGTGLGLAIAYGIIKKHEGYIQVYSEVGKGSTFKILLPVIKQETSKGWEVEAAASIKGGTETLLIAEDDASLRNLSRTVFESFGYSVITAEDGEDAIIKYKENRDKIHLVVLDMIMPKKNGKEAYEEIRKISPNIKTLFMSGYTMDIITKKELIEEGMDFIFKPAPPKDLLKKVRDALDR